MKIAVYLGARLGTDDAAKSACVALGHYLGAHHHELVYGGSRAGLMGVLASAAKESGAFLHGMQLQSIHDAGRSYEHLDALGLYPTLGERKAAMMEEADAFVILPGGIGTLDELTDIMSINKLSSSPKPVIVLNLHHYYDDLIHFLDHMVAMGYFAESERAQTAFVPSVEDLFSFLEK